MRFAQREMSPGLIWTMIGHLETWASHGILVAYQVLGESRVICKDTQYNPDMASHLNLIDKGASEFRVDHEEFVEGWIKDVEPHLPD